jgi:hypothetical protein
MIASRLPRLASSAATPWSRPVTDERTATPAASRPSRSSRSSGPGVALFAAFALATAIGGWLLRSRIPLNPESGVGYGLGIAGGGTMLLLLLYSARKHLRPLRGWGPLSHWFRLHMVLGVLAPLLILFHCNFRFGAPNSNVALVSMLIVASSGVVGRYIYTRISHGLYGARATLDELHAELDSSAHALDERLPVGSPASQRLAAFATAVRTPPATQAARVLRLVVLPVRAIQVRRHVLHDLHRDLSHEAVREAWDGRTRRANEKTARARVNAYMAALVKEAQFRAYERLFSLWHALHVPLFIMLLLTGIVHVVAVHMY